MKCLVIKKNKDLFFKEFENVYGYFKNNNSIFLKIFRKLNLPLNAFFGGWKKHIYKAEKIIFFDDGYNKQISKYIKKKNPNIKCIFWYWNSLIEYRDKVISDDNIDEIWSYNKFDAEKFGLKYNSQFYYKDPNNENNSCNGTIKKAVFLGREKGRLEEIMKIKKWLEGKNVNCDFTIIQGRRKLMKYEEYLEKIKSADIIIDICSSKNCGLSLRPLESIFFQKKLITDNIDIINYDFYNSNNVFVLNHDSNNLIDDFLKKPFMEIDNKIIDYYNFNSWLQRMLGA